MNRENPTISEVVEFRDHLLEAREDVLDKFFLLEDLLKADANREPEELRDIYDGLREGDRLLKGINEKLAYTHRLLLKFEDVPNQDPFEIHAPRSKRKVNLDTFILAVALLTIVIVVVAL